MIYTFILFFDIIAVFSFSDGIKNMLYRKALNEQIFAMTLLCLPIFAFLVGVNAQRADYENYLQAFIESPSLFSADFFSYAISQHNEIGYNYFQSFVKTIGGSATAFFVLFCFMSLVFRYKFYVAFLSKRDIVIVFLAFFAHEFLRKDCVQIRNGFASAIVLYSLVALYQGKRFRFVLTVILASCFQMTALVALPLVIARTAVNKKYIKFLRVLFCAACIFTVVFPIKNLLFVFSSVGLLPPAVENYLYWSKYAISMSLFNPQILKQVTICAFILKHRRQFFVDKKIFFLFQIYLVSTVYYLVFRDFEILAGRFGSLFYAVEAPILVLIIEKSKKNLFLKKFVLCGFYFFNFALNFATYQPMLSWKTEFN